MCDGVPVPDPKTPLPWPEALAVTVGRRVAHLRKAQKMTAQQLSGALAGIGIELKRTVIGNLESGYRRTVTLAEVLGIAYVLGVPPVLLMAPLSEDEAQGDATLPVGLKGWPAAQWITGERPPWFPYNRIRPSSVPYWDEQYELLRLYRSHEAGVEAWFRARGKDWGQQRAIEDGLRTTRELIRREGYQPPPLWVELQHIDEREGGEDDGSTDD